MFGYIVIHKPELKVREYEAYQAGYCGLCRSLRRRYGRLGQLALSFVMSRRQRPDAGGAWHILSADLFTGQTGIMIMRRM